MVPLDARQRLKVLAFLAFCGLIYAIANQQIFGAWLPVSGSVKALGGGTLNLPLMHQLLSFWSGQMSIPRDALGFLRAQLVRTVCMALGTAGLMMLCARRDSFAWKLSLALVLRFIPFAIRLVFFSSWIVWEWYNFPIFFFLVADFLLLPAILRAPRGGPFGRVLAGVVVGLLMVTSTIFTWREVVAAIVVLGMSWRLGGSSTIVRTGATAALGIGMLAVAMASIVQATPHANPTIGLYSRAFARDVRAAIGDAPVAMGDRAAAFAYFSSNSVSQLEGLVNDKRYLEHVEAHRPIDRLLCDRGVRYLISFEADLGDYSTYVVRPFRAALTSFDGPHLAVSKADEVLKLTHAHRYGVIDPDPIIYVWRFPCGKP